MKSEKNNMILVAEFSGPSELLKAAQKTRAAGYRHFDCHSPFPIHGMNEAMGLRRSPVGWFAGLGALIGAAAAVILQGWTSAIDYRLVLSGKPFFSWQAFVPIIFELAVLTAAIFAVGGMFFLNRLPRLYQPIFSSEKIARSSDDGFLLSVEGNDEKFDAKETETFLHSLGATSTERVEAS